MACSVTRIQNDDGHSSYTSLIIVTLFPCFKDYVLIIWWCYLAGDNIYGFDATDAAKSMDAAIAPAINMNLPWAAVIGNHDQEGTLSREGVMRHLVGMKNTLSRFNPEGIEIDGYGNYNLEVGGVEGTLLANKSVLNLYFLDSGDYSTVPSIGGYGWIKASQQFWFQQTSSNLQVNFKLHIVHTQKKNHQVE